MTTKDSVLVMLKKSNHYISGEYISKSLGISRAAVNSAVKSLRKEGYTVLSATNRGYCLSGSPDKLNNGELSALLPAEIFRRVICLDTTDSTNGYLRQRAQQDVPDGLTIIANEQTNGRGRRGRGFESPKGKGIYLSRLIRFGCAPSEAANITAWVAVAVCNAIEAVAGIRPGIKWVNDLVLNGKKICGILTEMTIESENANIQYAVTGIGINVNNEANDFSEDIRQTASSLSMETGRKINRAQLACEIIKSLDCMMEDWPINKEAYLSAYRRDCIVLGKEVRILRNEGGITGVAEEIGDDFSLVVRLADGRRESIVSGEVSVRGFYGYV